MNPYLSLAQDLLGMSAFPLGSRMHAVDRQGAGGEAPLFVKRDDELGGLLGGGKWRKWASLLPAAREAGVDELLVIGSARSAHVLSALSLGKAAGFAVRPFLRQPVTAAQPGMETYLALLAGEGDVTWVARRDWPRVEAIAAAHAEARARAGRRAVVIPEGGWHPWAFAGGFTLAWEMARHAAERGWAAADVWMEAGTGLSAGLLILGAWALALPLRVHVVGMALGEEDFAARLARLAAESGVALPPAGVRSLPWRFARPRVGRSFGSVPAAAKRTVADVAARHGLVLDALYGAKAWPLFWEDASAGHPRVYVHGGGGLSLPGIMGAPDWPRA